MTRSTQPETRTALMQCAESLLRSRGYSAFSYADLAAAVGIRKASIHYHFPTKEELGLEVARAYVARSVQACKDIHREQASLHARLQGFVALFMAGVEPDHLPLCGALAAEMAVLPERLQALTRDYFRTQLAWLQTVLEEGMTSGELPAGLDAGAGAHRILSLLEGVGFIDWTLGERSQVELGTILRLIGAPESDPG